MKYTVDLDLKVVTIEYKEGEEELANSYTAALKKIYKKKGFIVNKLEKIELTMESSYGTYGSVGTTLSAGGSSVGHTYTFATGHTINVSHDPLYDAITGKD